MNDKETVSSRLYGTDAHTISQRLTVHPGLAQVQATGRSPSTDSEEVDMSSHVPN